MSECECVRACVRCHRHVVCVETHNIDVLTQATGLCSQLCPLRDENIIQFTVGTTAAQEYA